MGRNRTVDGCEVGRSATPWPSEASWSELAGGARCRQSARTAARVTTLRFDVRLDRTSCAWANQLASDRDAHLLIYIALRLACITVSCMLGPALGRGRASQNYRCLCGIELNTIDRQRQCVVNSSTGNTLACRNNVSTDLSCIKSVLCFRAKSDPSFAYTHLWTYRIVWEIDVVCCRMDLVFRLFVLSCPSTRPPTSDSVLYLYGGVQ